MANPACALYGFPPALDEEFLVEYNRRSVPVVRSAGYLCVMFFVAFAARAVFLDSPGRIAEVLLGYQLPGALLWIAATHRTGAPRWLHRATFAVLTGVFVPATVMFLIFDPGSAYRHQPAAAMLLSLLVYACARLPFLWATAFCWTLSCALLGAAAVLGTFPLGLFSLAAMYLAATNVVGMYVAYAFEGTLRRDFLARREIALEREKSERLLLNVLPAAIAGRLKAGEKTIADAVPEVSIVFADIVGYTVLSGRLPAAEVVGLLDEVFSRFDALADKHGAEKIKTIGDAYMAVCGLSGAAGHADAAASLGLEMLAALESVNRDRGVGLSLRVGINSGPVVAGVIGRRKFSYDLWGDAVNVAARMESHGVAGRVHVSALTAEKLSAGLRVEARGTVEVKGKGAMSTYLLAADVV